MQTVLCERPKHGASGQTIPYNRKSAQIPCDIRAANDTFVEAMTMETDERRWWIFRPLPTRLALSALGKRPVHRYFPNLDHTPSSILPHLFSIIVLQSYTALEMPISAFRCCQHYRSLRSAESAVPGCVRTWARAMISRLSAQSGTFSTTVSRAAPSGSRSLSTYSPGRLKASQSLINNVQG
jgi:hypothetical protein